MDVKKYFVTEDKWLRVKGGVLDPSDQKILDGIGDAMIVSLSESLAIIEKESPEKMAELKKSMEDTAGRQLSVDEIRDLMTLGGQTLKEFEELSQGLRLDQAVNIRKMRVEQHYTWRAVARACSAWPNLKPYMWAPSNMLMGMALCERAAVMFSEHFRKEPWN